MPHSGLVSLLRTARACPGLPFLLHLGPTPCRAQAACPCGDLMQAKNLLPSGGSQPTQTARAVVELQEQLPDAKVLYSSATGASEPKQLA